MTKKFHVIRKMDTPLWQIILIKVASIVLAFLVSAIFATLLHKGSFADFFVQLVNGTFINSDSKTFDISLFMTLLETVAILAMIAVALTPCFKMKFWNIGAEGQMMAGVIATALVMKYLGPVVNNTAGLICIYIPCAIIAGGLFGLIPAIFKAYFKTNETLFTLMLNYVATCLAAYIIYIWDPNKGTVDPFDSSYYIPDLFGVQYLLIIVVAVVMAGLMFVYLRYSKHGYELTVVGESEKTAKYIGINRRMVIMRTVTLSGALCGLIGCLMLSATASSFTSTLTGGNGFTGVLISWLGNFNPFQIILYAFLFGFVTKGSKAAASIYLLDGSFTSIVTGTFFFFIIAAEFFVHYRIVVQKPIKEETPTKQVKKKKEAK